MRLEINTFARKGDLLDENNALVGRVDIGKGLAESSSADEWLASLDQALLQAGYTCSELPTVSLPLSRITAVDRFILPLEAVQ